MIARLQAWWTSRREEERRTLALGGIALAVLMVLGLIVLPLLDQHHALAQRLPGLRADTAAIEAQVDEAMALRARTGPSTPSSMAAPGGTAAVAQLQASLDAAGLRAAGDTVTVQAGEQIEIRLARAGFDAFLSWLSRTQRDSGLGAIALEADALDTPGMVKVHCVLAAPGGR